MCVYILVYVRMYVHVYVAAFLLFGLLVSLPLPPADPLCWRPGHQRIEDGASAFTSSYCHEQGSYRSGASVGRPQHDSHMEDRLEGAPIGLTAIRARCYGGGHVSEAERQQRSSAPARSRMSCIWS